MYSIKLWVWLNKSILNLSNTLNPFVILLITVLVINTNVQCIKHASDAIMTFTCICYQTVTQPPVRLNKSQFKAFDRRVRVSDTCVLCLCSCTCFHLHTCLHANIHTCVSISVMSEEVMVWVWFVRMIHVWREKSPGEMRNTLTSVDSCTYKHMAEWRSHVSLRTWPKRDPLYTLHTNLQNNEKSLTYFTHDPKGELKNDHDRSMLM